MLFCLCVLVFYVMYRGQATRKAQCLGVTINNSGSGLTIATEIPML